MREVYRIYPNLSMRCERTNRKHLDRMRHFLDDLVMPFDDGAVKINYKPVVVTYDFVQHPFEKVGEERPYVIKLYLSWNEKGHGYEINMGDYEFVKGTGEANVTEWEAFMQNVIRERFQEAFRRALEDYKEEKKHAETES